MRGWERKAFKSIITSGLDAHYLILSSDPKILRLNGVRKAYSLEDNLVLFFQHIPLVTPSSDLVPNILWERNRKTKMNNLRFYWLTYGYLIQRRFTHLLKSKAAKFDDASSISFPSHNLVFLTVESRNCSTTCLG